MTLSNTLQNTVEITKKWNSLIDKQFKNSETLRWSLEHKVIKHKDRVYKIQHKDFFTSENLHSVDHEYQIYKRLEKVLPNSKPELRFLDDNWKTLSINYIKTKDYDELVSTGHLNETSIFKVIWIVLKLSLCGISYSQLRLRHIFNAPTGIDLIDFGGSKITSPLDALYDNVLDPKRKKTFAICKVLLINKIKNIIGRTSKLQTVSAFKRFNRNNVPAELESYNNYILSFAKQSSANLQRTFEFHLDDHINIWGNLEWGLLWDHISRNVNFDSKSVLNYGATFGLAPAYQSLFGAKNIEVIEKDAEHIKILKDLENYLGVNRESQIIEQAHNTPDITFVYNKNLIKNDIISSKVIISLNEGVSQYDNYECIFRLKHKELYLQIFNRTGELSN